MFIRYTASLIIH